MKNKIIVFIFTIFAFQAIGQQYTENELRFKLDSLAYRHTGYNNKLQLNLTGLPLHELISSVALENNLNITVDPTINQLISYNFFDAQVKDMMVFLYLNFDIEYNFVGSILAVKKRSIKKEIVTIKPSKQIEVNYNPSNDFLSMDLKNDTLWRVMEKITKLSDKNFVISPDIRERQVNAFLQNRPFEQVLDMFSKNNGLIITKEQNGYFSVNPSSSTDNKTTTNNPKNSNTKSNPQDLIVKLNGNGKLDVYSNNAEIFEIIKLASEESKNYYIVYSNIEGKTNLNLSNVSFDDLLKRLFNGTKYHYQKKEDVFVIGENKMEGLRITELIRLENRTIENVKVAIPKDLTTDLEIIEFIDLNGLVVSGNERRVIELKNFLQAIDHVVPMVQIDVMLIASKKGSTVKTGIKAGIKDVPTVTSGSVFPELDVELGSAAINNILNTITGFGFVNLGQVTENFYLSLQALESNNVINIESTPKISTLNGHLAKIAIGQTTYYQETQVNVQTTINNQGVLQSRIWKSIDANLSVTLKPFVSSDEYVTIDVIVDQTDFSGRVDPTAPPNTITQRFESLVRVKNGELILLGGLEEKTNNQSGSGVPFLSRIPVLRWFFSSRTKEKEKSKLHILIRPVVTY
jgi:type IV pilus assembly protein PilQ